MARGSAFMANKTQAVRIPKSVRLPQGVTTVDILQKGRVWVITPSGRSWAEWFESERASDDFMPDRDQPAPIDARMPRHSRRGGGCGLTAPAVGVTGG